MNITVRLFAGMREVAGVDRVELTDLPDKACVRDARAALVARFPGLEGHVAAAALDLEYVTDDAKLGAATELAFIPPVSGG
ncbi:MAG: MoaD/ThiS family protein [Planctomycetes bacterium]|nr:MoaD/ThiS family protein [Planctomycetota bacterium]